VRKRSDSYSPSARSSWLPLHRCTVNGCDQSGAFDRPDGRCYFHGKVADGLFREHPRGTRTYSKYPWADWFDGNEHEIHTGATLKSFKRAAWKAACQRGVSVTVWTTNGGVYLRAGLAA